MRRLRIGGAVIALVAAGAGASWFALRPRLPDLAPAGPNRELAPETLAWYAEAPRLADLWAKLRATAAWTDLGESALARRVRDEGVVKDLRALVEAAAGKTGYALDAPNAMKLIGRDVAAGVALDPGGGPPSLLVLTKLDTAALTRDLLGGELRVDALQDELQRRTGLCGFTVTTEPYREHRIATARRGAVNFSAALLGDTLAVATDGALLRAAIDCRIARGERSIGRRAAYIDDTGSLPPDAALVEWYDLDALDKGRASLDKGLAALGAPPEAVAAVHGVLDGTRGGRSVARATFLPQGDLYGLTWSLSKSSSLFADRASPVQRDLYYGDWTVYGEARDLGGLAAAWERSSLKKRLADGEIGAWFARFSADPAGTARRSTQWLRDVGLPVPPEEEDLPVADEPPAPDRFALRMARRLVSQELRALLRGETAIAADWTAHSDGPRIAWTLRLDTEGRLAVLAAQTAMAAASAPDRHVTSETVGTRAVLTLDGVRWTLAGDLLVVSNDADFVRQAARSAGGPLPGPSPRLRDAVAAFGPGWRGFAFADVGRVTDQLVAQLDDPDERARLRRETAVYEKAGYLGRTYAAAVWPADDLSGVEVRARVVLAQAPPSLAALSDAEPRCWRTLPRSTLFHWADPAAGVPVAWTAVRAAIEASDGDAAEAEQRFRESMGMDLEKEVLPALGRETFLAVAGSASPPLPGEPPPPPRLLLGVEVRDPTRIRAAVERAVELAEDRFRADADLGGDYRPFSRETTDGAEILLFSPPDGFFGDTQVRPALALHGGFLLVASDVSLVREAVAARNRGAMSLADAPLLQRAMTAIGRQSCGVMLLDGSALTDQLLLYAPQAPGSWAGNEVPFPDLPPDAPAEERERAEQDWVKRSEAARRDAQDAARRWIETLRVLDYVGAATHRRGNAVETTIVLRFSQGR